MEVITPGATSPSRRRLLTPSQMRGVMKSVQQDMSRKAQREAAIRAAELAIKAAEEEVDTYAAEEAELEGTGSKT